MDGGIEMSTAAIHKVQRVARRSIEYEISLNFCTSCVRSAAIAKTYLKSLYALVNGL